MKQSLAICLGFITCAVAPLWPLEIKEARGKLESLGEVWTATTETVLYDRVEGDIEVARLSTCDNVQGVTGEVHVQPVEVEVINDFMDDLGNGFARGDRFFLLTSMGEGYFKAWADGTIFVVDGSSIKTPERCEKLPSYCNAILPRLPEITWWVQVEEPDGAVGWTRESQNFDGQDDCGMPRLECDSQ